MGEVRLTFYGEVDGDGQVYRFGSQNASVTTITGAQKPRQQTVVIGGGTPGAAELIWSDSVDYPEDFEFLCIQVDLPVLLELICDDDNSVGQQVFVVELRPGIPFLLGSDSSLANYTENFAAGTADTINTIRAQRQVAGDATLTFTMA